LIGIAIDSRIVMKAIKCVHSQIIVSLWSNA